MPKTIKQKRLIHLTHNKHNALTPLDRTGLIQSRSPRDGVVRRLPKGTVRKNKQNTHTHTKEHGQYTNTTHNTCVESAAGGRYAGVLGGGKGILRHICTNSDQVPHTIRMCVYELCMYIKRRKKMQHLYPCTSSWTKTSPDGETGQDRSNMSINFDIDFRH